MRIECETAAQCERLAAMMEAWIADAVVATVVLAVFAVVLLQAYELHRRSSPE